MSFWVSFKQRFVLAEFVLHQLGILNLPERCITQSILRGFIIGAHDVHDVQPFHVKGF